MNYYENKKLNEDFHGTIFEMIYDVNKERTENICITYLEKQYSYGYVMKKINDVAYSLLEMGVSQGDMVSICLPSIPEAIYLIYACSKIGVIANLIDPRINETRILECINGVKSKIVFFIDMYADKFKSIAKDIVTDKIVSVRPVESASIIYKILYAFKSKKQKSDFCSWGSFLRECSFEIKKADFKPNSIAAIVYSSGTTGVPKGVKLSNEGICHVAVHAHDMAPQFVVGDVFLKIMPPFLAYGLVCGICSTMYIGANVVLIPKFEIMDFIKLVKKYRPAVTMGVPNFFSVFVDNRELMAEYMKYAITGGDKMHLALESDINAAFKKMRTLNPVIKGYGMSELSSGVIISVPEWFDKPGSCGIPLLGVNIKVLNMETAEECTYNVVGELLVNSPSVMLGYLNSAEEESKIFFIDSNGVKWVRTGDLARIDEHGLVYIEGRIKRMIIRPDGHNVFPGVMEETLLCHEMVKAVGVVAISAKQYKNGQVPVALVVLKESVESKDTAIAKLKEYMLEKLPPRDVPMFYYIVQDIPYTSNGKIDYLELEKIAESLVGEETNEVR